MSPYVRCAERVNHVNERPPRQARGRDMSGCARRERREGARRVHRHGQALRTFAAEGPARAQVASTRWISRRRPRTASSVARAAGASLTAPPAPSLEPWPSLISPGAPLSFPDLRLEFGRFFRTSSTRQPSRACRPRRSHVNDVNPAPPRHVHKPPAHKRLKRSQAARRVGCECNRPRRRAFLRVAAVVGRIDVAAPRL
jgi:hypothetical protein